MKMYSYLMEHDFGLAPNPFGKYCTLAVCKPQIRNSGNLELGDWVIGTGSKALAKTTGKNRIVGKLIYAMQVSERITLEQYWLDERFKYKKPIMNGTLVTMYGDNFYHKDHDGNWIQEDSAHCNLDGTCNTEHLETDTNGACVLISEDFFYFGDNAPKIPNDLKEVCHTTQGAKLVKSDKLAANFLSWLTANFQRGIHGDPLNWIEYDQRSLF